ncbi:MAG: 23S rRNA (guanosine(2251)-2'-O)-methyltransferase RlmB [Candidatus Paceibacterota bacterium]|jgi:23S rRNA (guanosine2251-2'-O)-methyltransferase
MAEKIYLYGKNPLHEALLSTKRGAPMPIEKLYLTRQASEDPKIMSDVQTYKLKYDIVTYSEIESFVGQNTVHQGVCALLSDKVLYTPFEEVISRLDLTKNPLLILLDELQDPHNVGAIIRSAVAFGASAILIGEHDQTQITSTVIKTASGMNFAIPIVKIGNINTTLKKLKDEGFWTYGLTGEGDTELHTVKFDSPTVLVIGSEGNGIRAKTLEACDFKLSIKTSELCESLNASNATTVAMYEWRKQNIN